MISVCMATYNGAQFINEQINSILLQIEEGDELIISDDSSTDETVKLINQINDPRIKVYTDNKFKNHIKNFQNALQYAKGDYIFLSDQDDVWLPDKCKATLPLFENFDLILSDSIVVNEKLEEITPSFFKLHNSHKGVLTNIIKNNYFGSCMAFKRGLLEKALPFPDTIEVGHDFWLGVIAEITGKVLFWQHPTILYRRHTKAFSHHGMDADLKSLRTKSTRSLMQKLGGRAIVMKEVFKFYIKYKWKRD
jgi:glycosyltransferase involved in cell wall biosynthesis